MPRLTKKWSKLSKKLLAANKQFRITGVIALIAVLAVIGAYFILHIHAATCSTPPGDANCDTAVNVLDLSVLATNFGKTNGMTWSQGDFSGDGAVNVIDLSILASHWGTGNTSSGSCQFMSSPGTTPAFCDDFSEGPSSGGRSGQLDPARWSVSRMVGNPSSTDLIPFPSTPVSACKSGVSTVNPDNDVMVCDSASGHLGQALMAMSAQNYALLSMRPRQPFDFAGRTGTISYNVDAINEGGLSWWTSLYVTDQPSNGVNNASQVMGLLPRNGVGVNFDNCGYDGPCASPCDTANATKSGVNVAYEYTNYVETRVANSSLPTCVATQRGSLNHVEIRISQTSIQVWASDFSTDGGKTFPNFKQIFSAPINLPFSRGYIHFQQAERAPEKYGSLGGFGIDPNFEYANNYWSDLGFDGPVLPGEAGHSLPDALTVDSNNGALNVGYALGSSEQTATPFNISAVNPSGATSAELTFNVTYVYAFGITPSNALLHYRLNNGPWRDPNPAANNTAEFVCSGCPGPDGGGGVLYAFPVPLNDLVSGTNTVQFAVDNSPGSFPPVLSSLDLLTFTANAPTP